jgi:urease accessory protein UreE
LVGNRHWAAALEPTLCVVQARDDPVAISDVDHAQSLIAQDLEV